ncbi:MAG TPA: DNA polymerase III subunit gamma/tau [Actinomycetota bacterium]
MSGNESQAGTTEQTAPASTHQALYRRYRPQRPADLLGQDHVVRALTGSIREDRLHHAFLFCGPRGTGKTSTARILAKMVNCEQAPTAEPCDTCEQCVAIREGHHVDVVEIDAASHGGVDDARDLREKAPTAPMAGREKVYIIDEAQRLSREAFDALLKLFEEPPPGVRFVLATTEPHKMPATIVGRCQRFDFRRLTLDDLVGHLRAIAEAEGVELDPEAATAIARQAEGSARDALSLLDQATVLGGARVDDATVRALLGVPRDEIQHELADVVAIGDVHGAFQVVGRLVQDGQDLRHVTAETLTHFRNLLLVKTAPGQEDLLDIPADAYEPLRQQAEKYSIAELGRVIGLLLAAQNDMRWTTSPRITLELALVRASVPETDPLPAGVVARLERLERLANVTPGVALSEPVVVEDPAPPDPVSATVPVAQDAGVAEPGPDRTPQPAAPGSTEESPQEQDPAVQAGAPAHAADAGAVDVTMLRRSWPSLLEHLGELRQPVLRALLTPATPASFDGATLELAFPPSGGFGVQRVMDRQDVLKQALNDLFGIAPQIACVVRESREAGGPVIEIVDEDEAPDEAEALRRVQEMLGATPVGDPEE